MAEGSNPFGSGFLTDLSALMSGGGSGTGAPVAPKPAGGAAPSGDGDNTDFITKLRGYEDAANGRA